MAEINERILKVVTESGLSKTAFAERINVSQQYISKLCREGFPSDRTVYDICREFKVSENWLRTGDGEMFLHLSHDEEVAAFLGQIMRDDESSFRRRMISALTRLDPKDWQLVLAVAERLAVGTKMADPEGSA